MPKNDNAHSLRLVSALMAHAGEEAAKDFETKYPLSKSADAEKKFAWAQNACAYLEAHFDEETIRAVRRDCRCNDGKSIAAKMRKYLNRTDSLPAFIEDFNAHETFASLEYLGENKLLFCYPQCYCACVKRGSGTLSKTWCYCTLGNAQGIFSELFGEVVQVQLLESIKSGDTRCAIQVKW